MQEQLTVSMRFDDDLCLLVLLPASVSSTLPLRLQILPRTTSSFEFRDNLRGWQKTKNFSIIEGPKPRSTC